VTVPVDLDAPGQIAPLVLPPLGQLELELRDRGRAVATVAPVPPGRQWDWEHALERIGHVAGGELRAALLQRELDAERDAVGAGEEHLRRVP
jgi:hypothetical protein